MGFAMPFRYRARGGLLPRRFTLTRAVASRRTEKAVFSLLHFPRRLRYRALPGIALCGARTFLPSSFGLSPVKTGDCLRDVGPGNLLTFDTGAQRRHYAKSHHMTPSFAWFAWLSAALASAGCGGAVSLHAPVVAESLARAMPAKVDLDPMTMKPGADRGTSISGKRVAF